MTASAIVMILAIVIAVACLALLLWIASRVLRALERVNAHLDRAESASSQTPAETNILPQERKH
ncbi:MAG: hypothetical protein LBV00_10790 [Propionibacteriaceae bacterium]|jgi:type II secretory pathway component PulJ|nr:hypothetical protein [Propionibacteriaceae bacterium]